MLVAGVDDAGRGPIIGPLIIAGVLIDESNVLKLKALGVKDSKQLSPHRREELAYEIRRVVLRCHSEKLSSAEIDKVVEGGGKLRKLNRLEAHAMARVIEVLRPDVAYVDASDVLEDRFREHIAERLPFRVRIISEHKADVKYPVVSAASIIAKTERDHELKQLKEKYSFLGDMGSGYAADPKTKRFLQEWLEKYGSYPDFVRKSWKPAKKLRSQAEAKQKKLW